MMKENKHLTKKGLDKIHKIKAGMNRGREKNKRNQSSNQSRSLARK